MMLTLIEGGAIYTPEPGGHQSILVVGEAIGRIGKVEPETLRALGLPYEIVDANGCIIIPGLIDPHEHLIGAGGEEGFASRMPHVPLDDILTAGITTVVGLLGTDATTRNLKTLYGRVRQLEALGITAYMYTGSFHVPPPTITGSVIDDLVLIDKVIGVGEIAIADVRSVEPTPHELARLVSAVYLGGLQTGKAAITHYHTGPGKQKLAILQTILDDYDIPADRVYPTHINRSQPLLDDAITLTKRGVFVDMDTTEPGLGRWLQYYREHGGVADRLTVSSDAHTPGGTPAKLYQAFVACIQEYKLPIQEVLPHFTSNTACALRLPRKGQIKEQMDADLVILDRQSLEIRHVFARGRHMLKDGRLITATGAETE